jgi:hypothetical protein
MQATVVEFKRRAVGVAVRTGVGFRFFAAGREFAHLEGQVFRRISSSFGALNGSSLELDLS